MKFFCLSPSIFLQIDCRMHLLRMFKLFSFIFIFILIRHAFDFFFLDSESCDGNYSRSY